MLLEILTLFFSLIFKILQHIFRLLDIFLKLLPMAING